MKRIDHGTYRILRAHLYQPASLVGGDFFHVVRIPEHEAGAFICDVMGRDIRSALITAMLRVDRHERVYR